MGGWQDKHITFDNILHFVQNKNKDHIYIEAFHCSRLSVERNLGLLYVKCQCCLFVIVADSCLFHLLD